MTEANTLEIEIREGAGTGQARALRRENRIPGIIYGDKKDQVKISLEKKKLVQAFHKGSFTSKVFELKDSKETFKVLPREVQLHPVTDEPIHADFLRVADDSKVSVMVKVKFHNHEKSPGLKRGGVLNIVRHEIEFICPVTAIPEVVNADLTGLAIGDSIHISAIELPEGVEPKISDRDFTVAAIAGRAAKEEEEVRPVAAAEGEEGEEAEETAEGEEAKEESSEEKSE